MSQVTLFFALKEDILPVLRRFEAKQHVKYVTKGGYSTPDYELFLSGTDIPDLGKATQPAAGGCDSYLIFLHGTPVKMREVGKNPQKRGQTIAWCVFELIMNHADSAEKPPPIFWAVFWPGGAGGGLAASPSGPAVASGRALRPPNPGPPPGARGC